MNDCDIHQHSDPDFLVMKEGFYYAIGVECLPNTESVTTQGFLVAGQYIIDITDNRHSDVLSPAAYPEQICFEFSAN